MTRKEAIEWLKRIEKRYIHGGDEAFDEARKEALHIAIEALDEKPEPKWIPVSERLPEEPFGCLVTVDDCVPSTSETFPNLYPFFVGYDGERWNDYDGEEIYFEVLAWMPLPKPYEVTE